MNIIPAQFYTDDIKSTKIEIGDYIYFCDKTSAINEDSFILSKVVTSTATLEIWTIDDRGMNYDIDEDYYAFRNKKDINKVLAIKKLQKD